MTEHKNIEERVLGNTEYPNVKRRIERMLLDITHTTKTEIKVDSESEYISFNHCPLESDEIPKNQLHEKVVLCYHHNLKSRKFICKYFKGLKYPDIPEILCTHPKQKFKS